MGKGKKLLTISEISHTLQEYDVPNDIELYEKHNCIVVGNLYLPFDYFVAVQLCDKKQYRAFKEGLR